MFNDIQIGEIRDYITDMPEESKVYLGCDSIKFKKKGDWFARFTTVLVIHIAGKHGCKIFGFTDVERDYDPKVNKPRMRLMNEVYKVVFYILSFW